MAKRQRYDLDFKRRAVARMHKCDNVVQLADELKVDRSLLYQWRQQLEGRPATTRADLSEARVSTEERRLLAENRRLKEALGEKALEADFFAGALRRLEEQRQSSTASGETVCTPKSGRGDSGRKAN
jgi:transposase